MNAAVNSLGTNMLKAMQNEFRQIEGWSRIPEVQQQMHLDRVRRVIEVETKKAHERIAGGNFKRVNATLESVTFKDGVKIALSVAKDSDGVFDLAHKTKETVLIVLTDANEHVQGMETVKADADQLDAFPVSEEDKTASRKSWDELVASLEQPAAQEGAPPKSIGQQCQEFLAVVHVHLPVEVCEQWSEQECVVAAHWAIEFARNPETAPARPHWLPLPDAEKMHGTAVTMTDGAQDDEGEQEEVDDEGGTDAGESGDDDEGAAE